MVVRFSVDFIREKTVLTSEKNIRYSGFVRELGLGTYVLFLYVMSGKMNLSIQSLMNFAQMMVCPLV